MAEQPKEQPRHLTPEQQEHRERIAERNRLMQERGVPAPKSGTFGGTKKEKKDG